MKNAMEAAGKRLAFYFDVRAWLDFENQYYTTDELLRRIDKNDKPTEALLHLAAVTATAGARKEGRNEAISAEWLMDNLTPKQMRRAAKLAQQAWLDGMRREDVNDEDEDVDVVAAELAKKAPAGA